MNRSKIEHDRISRDIKASLLPASLISPTPSVGHSTRQSAMAAPVRLSRRFWPLILL
ncbi:hypothetical protein M427DRAFT_181438 [Gonapodya prolifera JEL478]|uniref:Uncharacterized protein n=1 Tax=Gonapodya prolifera (strain JEL478) TaxID=1344416 RepID=A0A139ARA8_GONPJ|nr:hypothetical protein M427DRAFT_181438 [Gonapodya prolifera JEL478]|eukprot:KXS19025.1 hypothetical protein M427DRAFT_181438 [Gonapodya prolifera JEL478]